MADPAPSVASPPRPAARAGRRTVLALAAALAALAGGCGEAPGGRDEGGGPPRLVVSIWPVGDLTRRLAGDDATVSVLVPPRADPSTFEVTPRQLRDVSGAAAFVAVGGGLDGWVETVPRSADVPVARITDGLTLKAGHGGHGGEETGAGNPHVWLDPVLVRDHVLPVLADLLVRTAPAAEARIRSRAAALADTLTALDGEIRSRLGTLRTRAFVATHPAWAYFADRYGLQEVGAIFPGPGREPSSRHLAELVEAARAARAGAVFTEPQQGETGARTLAAELGLEVHVLDPLGGPGLAGREGYTSLLRFNTAQLATALGGAS